MSHKKQSDLFDADLSEKLKKDGMDLAAANREDVLTIGRMVAKQIALEGDGTCHADQVGRRLQRDFDIESLGPAAGSLFKEKGVWVDTGRTVKSKRITNHSRKLIIWRLIR